MKSKASIFFSRLKYLVAALIVLLTGFFVSACDDPETFTINLSYLSGSLTVPTLSGSGQYLAGDRVELRAVGTGNCRFIGWIHQYQTFLSDGSVYHITTAEDNMSSTISFIASQETANNYTAVFEDNAQQYYSLTSYKFSKATDDPDQELTTDYSTQLFEGKILVEFGDQTNTAYRKTYSEETAFYQSVKVDTSASTQVFMAFDNTPSVRVTFSNANNTPFVFLTYIQPGTDSSRENVTITFDTTDRTYTIAYTFSTQIVVNYETVTQSCVLYLKLSPLTFHEVVEEEVL